MRTRVRKTSYDSETNKKRRLRAKLTVAFFHVVSATPIA
ncbi:hypothetical protein-signal peptide prediction [Rhodopirellula baltica SH 1]|uniref:Uncharacterized protein n=1 Tax=Rhodopirellula baltica (strain DSM 10527 / NCIMB 13988 / SH1) TaxID=243090 RepID=Q7UVT6_RHOBA|nr:hypothetical protein-signal peptide prediction [Rhodopirellula baltica SH 1]